MLYNIIPICISVNASDGDVTIKHNVIIIGTMTSGLEFGGKFGCVFLNFQYRVVIFYAYTSKNCVDFNLLLLMCVLMLYPNNQEPIVECTSCYMHIQICSPHFSFNI